MLDDKNIFNLLRDKMDTYKYLKLEMVMAALP